MSETVIASRCEALFRAGHDSLGIGLRGTVTDLPRLGERLVEVALLLLTKHIFQLTDVGRLAAVPTDLVAELAARRGPAATLADSGHIPANTMLKLMEPFVRILYMNFPWPFPFIRHW